MFKFSTQGHSSKLAESKHYSLELKRSKVKKKKNSYNGQIIIVGWINDFLSWSPFVVLGRLSYCTYLVHLICLQFYGISARENVYQTDFDLVRIDNVSVFIRLGSKMRIISTNILFKIEKCGCISK